jgi:hypothetical protein
MVETIDEPVDVVASFSKGQAAPRLFAWRSRRYAVREVTGRWSDYEGNAKRFFFTVLTDGVNLYELVFHTRNLQWRLLKIYME